MAEQVECVFKVVGWDEEVLSEPEGGSKITRVHVPKLYSGALQGDGVVEYLMAYKPDGPASFMGYESFKGSLVGIAGGFVLEHHGLFKEGVVYSTWTVVEGSGTGGLVGLRGTVNFSAGHQDEYPIVFEYELPT